MHSTPLTSLLGALGATAVAAALLAAPLGARAVADEHGHGRERHERDWSRHRDIRRFHEEDFRRWRGGHWEHGRHLGRLGWWWIVGGTWYFYPAPVYPYPDPYIPPAVSLPAPPPGQPPVQYWYYCGSLKAYYPYVSSCPEPWMQVVPQAPR